MSRWHKRELYHQPEHENKLVVYDHTTGVPYLLNPETNALTKIESFKDEEGFDNSSTLALLKGPDGRYRKEVKTECKRLFFDGCTSSEIEKRTGVKKSAVDAWIYGTQRNGSHFHCWQAEKRRFMEESRQKNLENYISIERDALSKIQQYLLNPKTIIENPRQFKEFAEGITKLLYVPGNPRGDGEKAGSNKTQININTNVVNPLTPEEAREILIADPIRLPPKDEPVEEATVVIENK